MSRIKGARNENHHQRRQELLFELRSTILERAPSLLSWRELASESSVSVNLLRHYFKDRNRLYAEFFIYCSPSSKRVLQASSVEDYLHRLIEQYAQSWVEESGFHVLGGADSILVREHYQTHILRPQLESSKEELCLKFQVSPSEALCLIQERLYAFIFGALQGSEGLLYTRKEQVEDGK